MKKIVEIKDLTFAYAQSDSLVLRDVNIDICRGEFVVVMGSSGSGKTTLLKMLKKNMIPAGRYTGEVCIAGKPVAQLSARENASYIGYVSQTPDNQIVTDKVWHELAFGLENLGYDNVTIRRKVAEMSEYFGITGWYDKNVMELSGGQKQILNLASIMVMQPGILLLDEPTANLDPLAATRFLDVVKRINQELDVTVIMVEHNLEHIYATADRVIAIDNGKVIADGKPAVVAENIISGRSFLTEGLPVAARLYAQYSILGEKTENNKVPLTVKEGREWYNSYIENNKRDYKEERNKEYNKKLADKEDYKEENNKKINTGRETGKHNKDYEQYACIMKDISYSYTNKPPYVIEDIDISFRDKSITAILGGNGSGKSTMLKLIAGINKPSGGKVISNKRIIMLPQDPKAVFTEISVEEELAEVLMDKSNHLYVNMTLDDKRMVVENIIEEFGLNDIRKNNPYDISGGQQEKLAIAKVLLLKPEVLLLDEPTNGLDPYFKKTLGKLLRKLNSDGMTIIIVSHDLEFVDKYTDDCIMLFDRRVAAQGNTKEFLKGNMFYTTNYYRIIANVY